MTVARSVAILQSCYVPWKGVFDLMHDVDTFVFYDDVQFTRQDWRSRNLVKTAGGLRWLSIPVGSPIDQRICDVALPGGTWRTKHRKTLAQAYAKTPHYDRVAPLLDELYTEGRFTRLSDLNQYAMTRIARDHLGLATELLDSRAFTISGSRTGRLLDLLGQLGASRYVSGPSARAYLDEPAFAAAGIELVYKTYGPYPEYPQPHPPFAHAVTIIDLLCCTGPTAAAHIWR